MCYVDKTKETNDKLFLDDECASPTIHWMTQMTLNHLITEEDLRSTHLTEAVDSHPVTAEAKLVVDMMDP
jgi:hypothetical protein